jgi:hypothetical protein
MRLVKFGCGPWAALCGLELELHDRRPHNCPSVDETPCADPNIDAVVID